jgi:hypothetical protein
MMGSMLETMPQHNSPQEKRPRQPVPEKIVETKNFDEQLQEITALMRQCGHVKESESLHPHLIDDLRDNPLLFDRIKATCEEIEAARYRHRFLLSPDARLLIRRYRFRNMEKVTVGDHFFEDNADWSGTNFKNATFADSECKNINFDNANFEGVELRGEPKFSKSLLHNARFSNIIIGHKTIDLETRTTELNTEKTWNIHKTELMENGACSDCERWNTAVLGIGDAEDQKYQNRGVLLFEQGRPIGYMKLKGEKTFLAMRTVRNLKGEVVFWKGMVYTLEPNVENLLKNLAAKSRGEMWRSITVEDILGFLDREGVRSPELARINTRFIADPEVYKKLDALVDDLESKKIPHINLRSLQIENEQSISAYEKLKQWWTQRFTKRKDDEDDEDDW